MKKTAVLTFMEVVPKQGVKNGKAWLLYIHKDETGKEYSSFDAYPVNTPIEIEFEEIETPGKDGRIFINRRIIRRIVKLKESNWTNPNPPDLNAPTQMDRIEAMVEQIVDGMLK
jgi:hypothetical protein